MPFFILFILIPLAELYVFGAVGGRIGLFNALSLALLTAIIGGAIVRHQGLQTLKDVQTAMNQGKIPMGELFDGICLIAAGATLITPGFITDTIGFLLLVPAIRRGLRHIIATHTTWAVHGSQTSYKGQYGEHPRTYHDKTVIDVEYEELDDEQDNPRK